VFDCCNHLAFSVRQLQPRSPSVFICYTRTLACPISVFFVTNQAYVTPTPTHSRSSLYLFVATNLACPISVFVCYNQAYTSIFCICLLHTRTLTVCVCFVTTTLAPHPLCLFDCYTHTRKHISVLFLLQPRPHRHTL